MSAGSETRSLWGWVSAHDMTGKRTMRLSYPLLPPITMAAGILVAASAVLHVKLGSDVALNHQTMTLSLFAFVIFTLIAVGMAHWSVTRAAGELLVGRVVNAVQNWEKETLRSFVEVSVWLGVMWSTFGVTQRFDIAILYGTMSGILVAVCGEALTEACRNLQKQMRIACGESLEASDSLASGSGLLLLIYGSVGLSMIYKHVSDITVAGLLAGAGGACILLAAQLIAWWPPTRRAGIMLQDRILNTRKNWNEFPLRSAIEAAMFLGVTIGVYANHHSLLAAIQAGFLTGMTVCLLGESVTPTQATIAAEADPSSKLVTICACVWVAANVCHWIFADMPSRIAVSFHVQICLAIGCGVLLHVAGRLFSAMPVARHAAAKLQRRLFLSLDYVKEYPLQTFSEIATTGAAVAAAWQATQAVQTTVLLGLLALLAVVLAADFFCRSTVKSPSTPRSHPKPTVACDAIAGEQRRKGQITLSEVRLHDRADDCWIAIHGSVYDVSQWHSQHPGGRIILDYAGREASDQFELFHPPSASHKLRPFLIGTLEEDRELPVHTVEYRQLRSQLWAEGYFEASHSYSIVKELVALTLIGLGVACLFLSPPTAFYRYFLSPTILGIGVQQAAFLAHDTLHNCVFRDRKRGITLGRQLFGQFNGGVIMGISASMWLEEHNMHHAYTLRPHADPQFTYFPLWLQTAKEVPKWIDALPTHPLSRRVVWRITQLLNRVQHLTWLPLVMIIGRFNFIAISWSFALKRRSYADLLAMGAHMLWFVALLHTGLPGVYERLLFTVVHYSVIGILHVQLLLSHMMADQFTEEEEAAMGVFKTQLLTSRNIRSHWWSHWLHGGLERQIEHHLFPQLPRHQLSRVAPKVRALAEKHNIPYIEIGFHSAISLCLSQLRRMSTAIVALGNPNL